MLSANPEFHGKRKYEEIENEDTYLLPDSLRRPHTYGILPQVSKVKNHTNPQASILKKIKSDRNLNLSMRKRIMSPSLKHNTRAHSINSISTKEALGLRTAQTRKQDINERYDISPGFKPVFSGVYNNQKVEEEQESDEQVVEFDKNTNSESHNVRRALNSSRFQFEKLKDQKNDHNIEKNLNDKELAKNQIYKVESVNVFKVNKTLINVNNTDNENQDNLQS